MNEIIKAMEERRSIRKFKPEMPKKEDLQQIVEAGLYAANGMGRQATITVAVTKKDSKISGSQHIIRPRGIWNRPFCRALLKIGDTGRII